MLFLHPGDVFLGGFNRFCSSANCGDVRV